MSGLYYFINMLPYPPLHMIISYVFEMTDANMFEKLKKIKSTQEL